MYGEISSSPLMFTGIGATTNNMYLVTDVAICIPTPPGGEGGGVEHWHVKANIALSSLPLTEIVRRGASQSVLKPIR